MDVGCQNEATLKSKCNQKAMPTSNGDFSKKKNLKENPSFFISYKSTFGTKNNQKSAPDPSEWALEAHGGAGAQSGTPKARAHAGHNGQGHTA